MSNQEIMNQLNSMGKTMYVEISKESGEASNKVFQTLNDEEKSQMQEYMRHAFKTAEGGNIPAGLLGIEDNQLTRRMFAGYIKY